MALVMLVVMGVEPGEPRALLKPARLGHVHAEVEIFVEKIIYAKSRYAAEENIYLEQMLDPENQGRVQPDDQGRVPPGESDVLVVLPRGEKISGPGAENTVVDQGVRSKRIRPKWLMHQEPIKNHSKKLAYRKRPINPAAHSRGSIIL